MGVVDIRQNGFASSPQCCCKLPQFLATDCLPSSSPSEVNGVPQSYLWLLRGAATFGLVLGLPQPWIGRRNGNPQLYTGPPWGLLLGSIYPIIPMLMREIVNREMWRTGWTTAGSPSSLSRFLVPALFIDGCRKSRERTDASSTTQPVSHRAAKSIQHECHWSFLDG